MSPTELMYVTALIGVTIAVVIGLLTIPPDKRK